MDIRKIILLLFIPILFTCEFNNKLISQVYKNSVHNLSFRYNSNWTEQDPQLESTLCLFYETKLNASCNISSIRADRSEVEKYDKKYLTSHANEVFNDVKNLNVRFEKIGPSNLWNFHKTKRLKTQLLVLKCKRNFDMRNLTDRSFCQRSQH